MQTNHFAETPITIDAIFKKVPELKQAFNLAQMISLRPGVPFCANSMFYGFFRPIIKFYVGWTRADHRRYFEKNPQEFKLDVFNANDLEKMLAALPEDRNQTLVLAHANQDLDYYEDRRLESCEAYDLVYRCIYDALPGCNHDCCCG